MNNQNVSEKLNSLMNSYVPEFAFDANADDPGSVMSVLCADMIDDSTDRFKRVLKKHKIQYLNLLDDLKKEPVATSKGYVQFNPVLTYEDQSVYVPKGTQVMAQNATVGDILFETKHDIAATNAKPIAVFTSDRNLDRIVAKDITESASFIAFDVEGENLAEHKLYLCFDHIFDYLDDLSFDLILSGKNKDYEEKYDEVVEKLTLDSVEWYMVNADGEKLPFDHIIPNENSIHFIMDNYTPQKWSYMQKEGYYIVASKVNSFEEFYIDTVQITMNKQQLIPEQVYVNGLEENVSKVMPFGKPLGLYNEFVVENKEVFSKIGANITLDFELDYVRHEESVEVQEMDIEYKSFMKKPPKATTLPTSQVLADYVVWEYLSVTGWKRIWNEEHIATMFNGTKRGHMTLNFDCPNDMAAFEDTDGKGRLRARLIRAENIYKMPAIYVCPVISGFMLSYSYNNPLHADYACTANNFEIIDVTHDLRDNKIINPFYTKEHENRVMYLGFDSSPFGSPISIYFDIENLSDRPITFTVEYLSDRGFKPVKVTDATNGFLGSGNMLFMLPKDMKKTSMYGTEGYFIRFVNYDKEHPNFALPKINGIYMNMAKVENINVIEEEFYLDRFDQAIDITLSQQNLLSAEVYIKEKENGESKLVLWKPAYEVLDSNRVYQIDYALGTLHLDKRIVLNTVFDEEGPQIIVKHSNYNGSSANVPEKTINAMRNSIRYISEVINPFPTYGGHDGYTEDISQKLIAGMLRTRNRAVTEKDFYDIISQTTFGVRKVKCVSAVDLFGQPDSEIITIAVLIDEYEKGVHIFSELKDRLRERLEECSFALPMGKRLVLTQPRFVKFSARVWIERDTMDGAYDIQNKAASVIYDFIDPLNCEKLGINREIGELPRTSQIISALRANIPDCNVSKIVMTAEIDGHEIPVKEDFYQKYDSPFIMGINGEHIVHIELV